MEISSGIGIASAAGSAFALPTARLLEHLPCAATPPRPPVPRWTHDTAREPPKPAPPEPQWPSASGEAEGMATAGSLAEPWHRGGGALGRVTTQPNPPTPLGVEDAGLGALAAARQSATGGHDESVKGDPAADSDVGSEEDDTLSSLPRLHPLERPRPASVLPACGAGAYGPGASSQAPARFLGTPAAAAARAPDCSAAGPAEVALTGSSSRRRGSAPAVLASQVAKRFRHGPKVEQETDRAAFVDVGRQALCDSMSDELPLHLGGECVARRSKAEAQGVRCWEVMVRENKFRQDTAAVRRLAWRGVPECLRPLVWQRLIGNVAMVTVDLYLLLCQGYEDLSVVLPPEVWEEMERDIARTFPRVRQFQDGCALNGPLRRVLHAAACFRPDLGYVQGMSDLVGFLLLNVEDEFAAFCMLANLIHRPLMWQFYRMDPEEIGSIVAFFVLTLRKAAPAVHRMMDARGWLEAKKGGLPEITGILSSWVMVAFVKTLPLVASARLWDVFLAEGDVFLPRAAVGFLVYTWKELGRTKALDQLIERCNGSRNGIVDVEQLLRCIKSVKVPQNEVFTSRWLSVAGRYET